MAFQRMIHFYSRFLILLVTVLLCLCNVAPLLAQAPSFGLRPQEAGKAYFEYNIGPGAKIQDVLVVTNPSDQPLSLTLRVARGTTMATGGITFGEETSGPAQWVTLSGVGIVEVAAQTSQILPFEVNVPAGTPSGDYVVGFLATPSGSATATISSTQASGEAASGFNVIVVSQVGVAMIITVPEANHCEATISSLTSESYKGRWQLGMGMQNTGNQHFKGTGEFIARPAGGGEPVAQSPFTVGYFIPSDTITYPLTLEPYPAAGEYEIEINLITDCGFETTFTQALSISDDNVAQAVAEGQAKNPPPAAPTNTGEATELMAQVELFRFIALILGGLAVLAVAGAVIVVAIRRRPKLAN